MSSCPPAFIAIIAPPPPEQSLKLIEQTGPLQLLAIVPSARTHSVIVGNTSALPSMLGQPTKVRWKVCSCLRHSSQVANGPAALTLASQSPVKASSRETL